MELVKKIGILDSGVGGLSLLADLLNRDLAAEFYYISDSENVPYGGKSQEFMLERTIKMVKALESCGIKTILIACNTLTTKTIRELRLRFSWLNFIGIEPYIKYGFNQKIASDEHIGMILTEATYHSERFKSLRQEFDPQQSIKVIALKGLAMAIESLSTKNLDQVLPVIKNELLPLNKFNFTHLILGCTHYPLIKSYIEDSLKLVTIDPHIYVVQRLIELEELKQGPKPGRHFWYNPNLSTNWEHTQQKDLYLFENLNIINAKGEIK
ncbi:MAG: aspartate/glutamate racemase family protein [Bacteriovoracaceae bacterium]|jgi:glutamate racemase|nr:aspartate/glutamate racemase family protein [Bacteriovoracaceae bacterium]